MKERVQKPRLPRLVSFALLGVAALATLVYGFSGVGFLRVVAVAAAILTLLAVAWYLVEVGKRVSGA